MELTYQNTDLDKLFENGLLSVRSYHICSDQNLMDSDAISDFYRQNHSFKTLRSCGEISNNELIKICSIYDTTFILADVFVPNNGVNKIEFMDSKQKSILENVIKIERSKLSKRSINALTSFRDGIFDVNNIGNFLNFCTKDINSIDQIGEKSASEIKVFINNINQQIEFILSITDENKKTAVLLNKYLQIFFTLKLKNQYNIFENEDFSRGIPIFKILKVLIDKEILFNPMDSEIFTSCFNYFKETQNSLVEDDGFKLRQTTTVPRCERLYLFERLPVIFSFLNIMKSDVSDLYYNENCENFIMINENLVTQINQTEENNFNIFFITKILSILHSKRYALIGDEKNIVLGKRGLISHNWRLTYLIKRGITEIFDFNKFVEDIGSRLSESKKNYHKSFTSYLLKFLKGNCVDEIENIREIASYILLKEFELSPDADDKLYFRIYAKQQVKNSILLFLRQMNELVMLNQLFEMINQDKPGYFENRKQLSEFIKNIAEITYFENTKMIGLKVWIDNENSSGLTIKDLAIQYLTSIFEPVLTKEVIKYIKIHHYGTSEDILSNLKFDSKKIFAFQSSKHLGLKAKRYVSFKFISLKKVKLSDILWEENYNKAKAFIREKKRLPINNGSATETAIYKFLKLQKSYRINDRLRPERIELLENIGFLTKGKMLTKVWIAEYEKLKHFREVHSNR